MHRLGTKSSSRNIPVIPHDEYLRIFSWNVNRCDDAKVVSITQYLNQHRPHLALLSECNKDIPWNHSKRFHENLVLLWDAEHVNCQLLFEYAKTDKTIDKYCSVKVTSVRYKTVSFIFHGVYGDPEHGLDLKVWSL